MIFAFKKTLLGFILFSFSLSLVAVTKTLYATYEYDPAYYPLVQYFEMAYSVNKIGGPYDGTGLSFAGANAPSPINVGLGTPTGTENHYQIQIDGADVDNNVYFAVLRAVGKNGEISAYSNECGTNLPTTPTNFRIIGMIIQPIIDEGVSATNTAEMALGKIWKDSLAMVRGEPISPALTYLLNEIRNSSNDSIASKSDLDLVKIILDEITMISVTGNIIQYNNII